MNNVDTYFYIKDDCIMNNVSTTFYISNKSCKISHVHACIFDRQLDSSQVSLNPHLDPGMRTVLPWAGNNIPPYHIHKPVADCLQRSACLAQVRHSLDCVLGTKTGPEAIAGTQ